MRNGAKHKHSSNIYYCKSNTDAQYTRQHINNSVLVRSVSIIVLPALMFVSS